MKKITWPAWFSSPDGKTSAIFGAAEDVPNGWTSGAEKQTLDGSPHVPPSSTDVEDIVLIDEVDAHGWPWSAELHASSKSKTKNGLWRMKVGVSRPDPKPGRPLDL